MFCPTRSQNTHTLSPTRKWNHTQQLQEYIYAGRLMNIYTCRWLHEYYTHSKYSTHSSIQSWQYLICRSRWHAVHKRSHAVNEECMLKATQLCRATVIYGTLSIHAQLEHLAAVHMVAALISWQSYMEHNTRTAGPRGQSKATAKYEHCSCDVMTRCLEATARDEGIQNEVWGVVTLV